MENRSNNLTIKQRMFVKEYASTGNATQAALHSYNCSTPKSADAVARETLDNPRVQLAISELMKERGLDNENLLSTHKELLESSDPAIRLRALDMAYKLNGSYKHVQLILSRSEHVEVKPPLVTPNISDEEIKESLVKALLADKQSKEWRQQERIKRGLE